MAKLFKGIFNLIFFIIKGVFVIIFIVLIDHIIIGLIGGALVGLFKGGSGLFHMGFRSWAVGVLGKKG